MKQRIYNAALYCRLSRDDELYGESSSISTQRKMLRDFAAEQGFHIVGEYIDDGWSGTNFDRPDFQRMIDDIEDGKINCVITKDLSRLGRNYILTGQYTEIYFPSKNVDRLFVKTYEDFACGRLDEENYEMLRTKYRNEQIQLAEQISQYEEKLTATKTTEENVRKWIDLISKYSEINELTAPLLNELIEKIVVHEKRIDTDGKPTRDIEIYYRFVGRID